MLNSEQNELIHAKELIEHSKYDEALQIIKRFENKKKENLNCIVHCHLLKCNILIQQGLYKKAFKFAERTYRESLGLGKNVLSVDVLLLMVDALLWLGRLENVLEIINQAEMILKELKQELSIDYKEIKAYLSFLKGYYYGMTYKRENVDISIDYLEKSLNLFKELGFKWHIINTLTVYALFRGSIHGDLNLALKCNRRSLELAEEFNSDYLIAMSLKSLYLLYAFKGEYDQSYKCALRSFDLFKKINNKVRASAMLGQIGEHYRRKGNYEQALNYLEQSLALQKETGSHSDEATIIGTLLEVAIAKGDLELAQTYFMNLDQLNKQDKNTWINLIYRCTKALLLKTSRKAKDRVEAENIYKEIIDEIGDDFAIIDIFLELCDLLLLELELTSDVEVLREIDYYVSRLLNIAEISNSFLVLGETYLLQAKLALIRLDFKEARQLLTKGQQIAEKYDLSFLAIKISNEHDKFLKELGKWEIFKETKASFQERLKLSRLSEQMDHMVKKRAIESSELIDEDPVVILIISEGGNPIFSQKFLDEWNFQDHLFGGFLTAVNSFSVEMLNEGLDRASFGEYTLLMKSIFPFLVCYLFKGKSYLAQRRLKYFADKILKDLKIWDKLNKFFKTNQEIRSRDIPSLEIAIKDIFINKKMPSDELESIIL